MAFWFAPSEPLRQASPIAPASRPYLNRGQGICANFVPMRLVTWNVNSLKVRMPRVLELLEQHRPDVVCLQETKANPDAFPELELQAAGYDAVHASGGRWAGVAILAKHDANDGAALTDEHHGLP